MTIIQFMSKFPTEEAAIDYYIKIRYNGILTCPHCCAKNKIYRYRKIKKLFHCKNCNNSFSPFKNTIFEKSSTDFRKWLYAIRLFLNARKGFPALQLQRELEVTYKTAFRIFHQVRIAMQNGEFIPFEGIVEMDETYFGGKTKIAISGIKERTSGRVYSQVMPPNGSGERVSSPQLKDVVVNTCVPGTTVITDGHPSSM
jgi:transposase-like protein